MKTSQTFFYNEENGNIQYLDKRGFIGELCIVISKKDKNILCLDEIKKIYNLSYKDIVKKFEKVFKRLDTNIYGLKVQPKLGLICLIDKSTEDFEKYCKKNKLKFGQEVSNINKKNLFTKEGKCDIINYKPKESKEELKKMNKKLVKRVAVASLAALMTIPNLNVPINNVNTVYADIVDWDAVYAKQIKEAEEKVEYYKSIGNESQVKQWQKKVEIRKRRNEERKQEEAELNAKNDQIEEQRQAKAVEAERIANKVYPLEYNGKPVYYTKDFIEYVKNTPELNDFKPHWYEAADMPGLKFHLVLNETNDGYVSLLGDSILGTTIENLPDGEYIARFNGSERQIIHKTQMMKIKFISPFETMGIVGANGNWSPDFNAMKKSGATGDGYIARGLNTFIEKRDLEWRYGDGWPEGYKGIILGSEQDPNPNWRGNLRVFSRLTVNSQKAVGAEFNTHTKEGGRDVEFSKYFGKEFEIIYDGIFDRYKINDMIADEYK